MKPLQEMGNTDDWIHSKIIFVLPAVEYIWIVLLIENQETHSEKDQTTNIGYSERFQLQHYVMRI